MAAEERAKSEFSEILSGLERKFDIMDVKWADNKQFEIKFRTQVDPSSDDFNALCDEWVDLFSETTNTVWAKKISNTGPKIRFRKQYQCWTHGGKVVQKELLFDARRCKGTLDIKVLTDNPFTRRKNKHIRLGLNVVVKINFVHLHDVDALKPYSFFVHLCEPQPEAPKPIIQPNERLPQLVAEMVQKGINASPKVVNLNPPSVSNKEQSSELIINNNTTSTTERKPDVTLYQSNLLPAAAALIRSKIEPVEQPPDQPDLIEDANHLELTNNMQHHHHQQQSSSTIQLMQNVPLQNMETIKLELPSHLQQYTQVVVSDMAEPLLMCQSLMFDTSQVIHGLPSHFVQIHSPNLHNQ